MEMECLSGDTKINDTKKTNEVPTSSWFSCCNPNKKENTPENQITPEKTDVNLGSDAFKMKIEELERKVEEAEEENKTLTQEKSEAEETINTLTKEKYEAEAMYKLKVASLESEVAKLKEELSKIE